MAVATAVPVAVADAVGVAVADGVAVGVGTSGSVTFDTKALLASLVKAALVVWKAPATIGKLAENVFPVRYTDPLESTAMPAPSSRTLPPR